LRGCSEYIAKQGLNTKIIAVDAVGSVIFGDTPKRRLIPGHGAGIKPPHYRIGLEHSHMLANDLHCVVGCRRLIRREAIFAGGSSGAVMWAMESIHKSMPSGSTCVVILADRGGRYLDTIYNDAWVTEHFGDVVHLWASDEVPETDHMVSLR
jgi:cysteine synthase A